MVLRTRPLNKANDPLFAPPVSVLNRGDRQLTDEEAAQVARVALFAKRERVMSLGDLCDRWRLSRSQGYELLEKWKENGHARRTTRSGRPKVITPRLEEILVNIGDEKEGRLNFAEPTFALNKREGTTIDVETVRRYRKENKWGRIHDQYVPILTDTHVARRMEAATENLHNTWCDEQQRIGWVDVDEKQFHARTLYQCRLRPPRRDYGRTLVKHKGCTPKIMVLTAFACPVPAFNFDGKLGSWRFTEKLVAKRDSKNRPKGTIEEKDSISLRNASLRRFSKKSSPSSEERCTSAQK